MSFRVLVLAVVFLVACVPENVLLVQLQSDLVPGREIDRAEVTLGSGGRERETTTVFFSSARSLGRPLRLAGFGGLASGTYSATVVLLRGETEVQRRRIVRNVTGVSVVTLLMTRDCNGVTCGTTGDPSAVECLGGRCVPEDCDEEHPERCLVPVCASDADCGASAVACAQSRCTASGACFAEPDDARCGASETCDSTLGCVRTDVDAGPPADAGPPPDAGRDVGVDGALEAGSDAGCPWPEMAGRCVPPPLPQLDVNGDGFGDLAVGASGSNFASGALYLYLGSPEGPIEGPVFDGPVRDARVGLAVTNAHDTNGDGRDDVLVSQHNLPPGHALLFLSGPATTMLRPDADLGAPDAVEFGQIMAGLGDVDANGFADAVVAEDGRPYMHVFRGMAAGLASSPSQSIPTHGPIRRLLGPGDVSGDSVPDLVVTTDEGVFVYLGERTGFSAEPTVQLTAVPASIASADVDGDGLFDVVVGDPSAGSITTYLGAPGGPDVGAAAPVISFPLPIVGFGAVVAGLGDLDADGFEEVAVVSDLDATTHVTLFRGSRMGLLGAGITLTLPTATMRTRIDLCASDVDGDGSPELVVGDTLLAHVYVYRAPLAPGATIAWDLHPDDATSRFGALPTR